VALRDLRVLHRIEAGQRLVLHCHLDGSGLGDLDLRDDAGRPCYRATSAPPTAPGDWAEPSDVERLADPYTGTTLFHGPALRVIRSAAVGGSGADATIDGAGRGRRSHPGGGGRRPAAAGPAVGAPGRRR
jgi:hypothetical protein